MTVKSLKHLKLISKKTKRGPVRIKTSLLSLDGRTHFAPFDIEMIESNEQCSIFIRVYATLNTPGAEVLTLSYIDKKTSREYEGAFDELYVLPKKFKNMSVEEKKKYIKTEICNSKKSLEDFITKITQSTLKKSA